MHRRILTVAAVTSVFVFSGRCEAQSFGFSFGSSSVVDHIVSGVARKNPNTVSVTNADTAPLLRLDTSVLTVSPDRTDVSVPGTPPAPPAAPFWKEKTVSALYEFRHKDSSTSEDRETDIHFVGPTVHLKTREDFVVDLTVGYANTTIQDDNDFDTDADSFALFVVPSQELLGLGMTDVEKATQMTFLYLGVGIGYRNTSADSDLAGLPDETDSDALTVSPGLLLTHVAKSLTTTATGGIVYAYETSDNDSTVLGHVDDSKGVASLLVRGDFFHPMVPIQPTDHPFQAWLTAQWNHDTKAPDFPYSGNSDDWAEVGVFVNIPTRKIWQLHAGYTLEAFHTDFTQHRVELRIDRFL